ncbi:uncharacterized protein TNCV_2032421 [Trichonephila clavipes]|nr:uncharacterized protein TNCV_2032421 [Trichonephila clavipes]
MYPLCMIVGSSVEGRVLLQENWVPKGHVALLRGKDHCIQCTAVAHRTVCVAEIRAAVDTTVTQRTVRNRLLQGELRARRPVACIPLTPSHCRLRHAILSASDDRVLVRRRPEERLHSNCMRPKHTGPTPGVMFWGVIFKKGTARALSWLSQTHSLQIRTSVW